MGIFNGNNNQPPAGQPGNGQGEKPPAKPFSYRCAEACTYGGKAYREGEILLLAEKKEVPHFKIAGQAGA